VRRQQKQRFDCSNGSQQRKPNKKRALIACRKHDQRERPDLENQSVKKNQDQVKRKNSRGADALQAAAIARRDGLVQEVKVVTVREESKSSLGRLAFNSPRCFLNLWQTAIVRASWYHEDKEHMVVFCLDTGYRLKSFCLVSIGSLNECISHPREIFRPAIADSAHSIAIVHNHPSGEPAPSKADIALTRRTYSTGELLQIPLLDHVIVGGQEYFSFREGTWPPRATRGPRATTGALEELRVEEEALQVARGGPALAARKMDHQNLAGGIKEQARKLEKDPAYMHGPRAEIIAALALELYHRSREKVAEQKK
jgi:DNA repair protein RadC